VLLVGVYHGLPSYNDGIPQWGWGWLEMFGEEKPGYRWGWLDQLNNLPLIIFVSLLKLAYVSRHRLQVYLGIELLCLKESILDLSPHTKWCALGVARCRWPLICASLSLHLM